VKMSNFQNSQEGEIGNDDNSIEVLLDKLLPNLSLNIKQNILQKFYQFNVLKIEDFILLEGYDEKIEEIASACPSTKSCAKLVVEITKIIDKQKQTKNVDDDDDNKDEKSVNDNIKISVSPFENIENGEGDIAVIMDFPDSLTRTPVDVCCVIDTSGSMGDHATSQDPEDPTKTITYAITILDLVKHGVKTVIHTLTDQDRLSIVAFNSVSNTVLTLTTMDNKGKKKALKALEKLQPSDSTNIWAGLYSGLESLRQEAAIANTPRKSFVLLLTDGQPVESPQNGEDGAMKKYFDTNFTFKCQVNTFGFGYSLNSKLLLDMATIGNGVFGFIPDAKIIGTCFVSAVANFCTTLSQNCIVHLRCCNGSSFVDDSFKTVKLSPIQFGQHRDIIVPMKNIPVNNDDTYLQVTLEYEDNNGAWRKVKYNASSRIPTGESMSAFVRNKVIRQVNAVVEDCSKGEGPKAAKNMKALVDEIAALEAESILKGYNDGWGTISAINDDVSGRIAKSVSTIQRFKRWGAHYLRALMRAYHLQLRTNNMDKELQKYGGELFHKLEEECGKIFLTLPLKTDKLDVKSSSSVTINQTNYQTTNQTNNQPSIQVNSGTTNANDTTFYGGSSGGCFASDSTVQLLQQRDHTHITTQIKNVRKNDIVRVVDGYAQVLCVVEIVMNRNNKNVLVELKESGLKITPKHPVYFNDCWCLPVDLVNQGKADVITGCDGVVYNLVLNRCHVLFVNDIPCVTLGHGLINNPITYDKFYATHHVIDFLNKLSGAERGFVKVHGSMKKMWKLEQQKQNNNTHQMVIPVPVFLIH